MLNEALRDEELGKILFAHLLNQNGCDTGVNTEELFEEYLKESFNEMNELENDTMREPDYYAGNGLSPIGAFKQGLISQEELIGFYKGNIIKYVVRAGHKENTIKDLLKAQTYINFYLELFKMTESEKASHEIQKQHMMNQLNGRDTTQEENKMLLYRALTGLDDIDTDEEEE